jgi:hypothetical protein
VTGVIEELTADALTLETALKKLSIVEETKEDHHLQTPKRYDRG